MVEALVEEAKLIMAEGVEARLRRATKAPKPKPKPTARCCSTTEGRRQSCQRTHREDPSPRRGLNRFWPSWRFFNNLAIGR